MAFHIKDDRYSYIEKDERFGLKRGISNSTLAADSFDTNAWLVAIRQGLASVPAELVSPKEKMGRRESMVFAGDSLPPINPSNSSGFLNGIEATMSTDKSDGKNRPDCFALVGMNRRGTVMIQWCNPLYKNKYIHIAGVMNQAAAVVTEFCPCKSLAFGDVDRNPLLTNDWLFLYPLCSEQSPFSVHFSWTPPLDCTWW